MSQNLTNSIFSWASVDTRKTLDPIHSYIEFDKDIWKIIDTLEFQRLRDIKQLGSAVWVFASANHVRFEHSLGTGYLAQKYSKRIINHQPHSLTSESIDEKERIKRNITLAGLCHDLGHGPFSHLFDGLVLHAINPTITWTHEQGSVMMFKKLIDENNIDMEEEDIRLISDLILGNSAGYETKWIFDVVANKRNSVDVDKFDYMARDSYHLGLKDTYFDYLALMKEGRIIGDQICYPTKLSYKIYELFQARYRLYKNIYFSRKTQAVDLMIAEALREANHVYKFHEIITNPEKYLYLTDYVLTEIQQNEHLAKSSALIKRIKQRKLFKFVSETLLTPEQILPENEEKIKVDILSYANNQGLKTDLKLEDFDVLTGSINYSMKDKNPVDSVKFYKSQSDVQGTLLNKDQVSLLIPQIFCEKFLRIFVKDETKMQIAADAFSKYCNKILQSKVGAVEGKCSTPSVISTPSYRKNFADIAQNINTMKNKNYGYSILANNSNSQPFESITQREHANIKTYTISSSSDGESE